MPMDGKIASAGGRGSGREREGGKESEGVVGGLHSTWERRRRGEIPRRGKKKIHLVWLVS